VSLFRDKVAPYPGPVLVVSLSSKIDLPRSHIERFERWKMRNGTRPSQSAPIQLGNLRIVAFQLDQGRRGAYFKLLLVFIFNNRLKVYTYTKL
jgi:hypothetical protein